MSCFSLGVPSSGEVKKPIVDLDELIKDCVWADVDYPVLCFSDSEKCKRKKLDLNVDWNYLIREDTVTKFDVNKDLTAKNMIRNVCLFETVFDNKSTENQQFTFKNSRQTTSSFEICVQEGLSIGGNFNFAFSLDNPGGIKDDEKLASSSLGGHITWSATSSEKLTKTDTLSWGVDSQVTVKGGQKVLARLGVREVHFLADLEIETTVTVTAASKLIPIDVRRKSDNELVQILDLSCKDLCRESDILTYDKERPYSFKYKTSAICEAVYGAEQFVSVVPLVKPTPHLACGTQSQNIDTNEIAKPVAVLS